MPLVAIQIKCDDIRLSSAMSMRIHMARGGSSTPSRASVAMQNTSSLAMGDR